MKKIKIPTRQDKRIKTLEYENDTLKKENGFLKERLDTQEQAILELSMYIATLNN